MGTNGVGFGMVVSEFQVQELSAVVNRWVGWWLAFWSAVGRGIM